jgi:hypothetical protein
MRGSKVAKMGRVRIVSSVGRRTRAVGRAYTSFGVTSFDS